MIDWEKVIKALKNCTDKPKCRDCPWETCEVDHEYVELPMDLAKQALAMLEAQEPLAPKREVIGCSWHYYCGACSVVVDKRANYCSVCGRAVKWK